MEQAQSCTTRGTGSEHTGPACKSASRARGEAQANPGPHPRQSPDRERAGHPLPCFSPQSSRPRGRHGALWPYSPSQGSHAMGGSRKAAEGEWELGTDTTTVMGTPGPRDEKRPHLWLGGATPALGRLRSCTPTLSKGGSPLPILQVLRIPPPHNLPDARQEQGTAPTGTPCGPETLCPRQRS